MADNYEDVGTSSTYGESDDFGGGEQIASAIYLNEQLQQQTVVVMTKQNAVVLQPTTPPLNPAISDMWIDTAIYPNIIYTWNGTQWNRATVTSADEVGAYTIAQTDDSINTVRLDVSAVSSRTNTVEETLANGEGLASTVTQTNAYKLDRDDAIDDKVSTAITDLNVSQYVTQSKLTQTTDDINAKFQSGGGVNMVKNSVGYAGLLNWQVISGAASQYIGSDCIEAGSGLSITDGIIKQAISAIAGQPYTITAKVKKGTAGTAYMKLSDGTTFQEVDMINTAAYDYKTIQISGFVPANNTLIVELSATGATGGAIFTAIIVNIGVLGLQWSHANGEMYTTGVSFDINGVKVNSSIYDGYTVMSQSEFSGYYRNNQGVMQKVFTLNKDVTEVAKLKVTDPAASIEMGSIKAVYINGGGYRGWAFIPS